MTTIGVDIGGSHISSCMYEHSDKVLLKDTLVNRTVDNGATREEILDAWASAITQTARLSLTPFRGIGIAIPGPFDYYRGICLIKGVNKYEHLYQVNIRQELSGRLAVPEDHIRFINDATAFSIAEALVGESVGYSRHVAITLGTGLGSSFLVDSRPVMQGERVPAGGYLYDKMHGDRLADDVFSTRGLLKKYDELSGEKVREVLTICQRIPTDPQAAAVFNWFGQQLGRFLSPFLNRFNAEVLILGGNIAKASPYFLAPLAAQLPKVKIVVSRLGEEAAMIGGALMMDDSYYHALQDTLKIMK